MTNSRKLSAERIGHFSAFRYRQYPFLWLSSFIVLSAHWMQAVVVAWLVLELTNSPFLVGVAGACRSAGMLLGPLCGTIADRFDRRRILFSVRVVYCVSAITLMTLFFTSALEVWHIFLLTLATSIGFAFDYATRFAVAADIVETRDLNSAIALLYGAQGATAFVGPLLGGDLFERIGVGNCFAAIAGFFFLGLLTIIPMKLATREKPSPQGATWKNLVDGLSYVRDNRALLALIVMAALVNLLVFPYSTTLLPVFARDVLQMGAGGLGQLMGAAGLGGLIGSLIAVILGRFRNKGNLLIAAILVWPAALMILAASHLLYISLALLFVAGIAQGFSMAILQTFLLAWSSEEMRGRVSGVRAFAVVTCPLGNIISGAEASRFGAPIALAVNGFASILITIFIAIWAPQLRKRP